MSSSTPLLARQLTLTIPHICDNIVHHLSSDDVRNCTTVSKEFHQAFVPYNWRFIHISQQRSYTSFHDSVLASNSQVLVKNQHRIQALSSVYPEIWDLILQTDTSADSDAVPSCAPPAPFSNLTSLHALSSPTQGLSPCSNLDYAYQLHTVIENSPRLQELKIIDHYPWTSMQLNQLSHVIRGHSSLKSLTLQTEEMALVQYKRLLWSCWNLEKLDITTSFYNRPKLPAEAFHTDDQEQELDMWLAENRPHICAAAVADDKRSNINADGKVLFQLKEFYIYTGRYHDDFGIPFPFLRRCRGLKRFRPPRIESEHLLEALVADIPDCWPDMEHLDMGNCGRHRQDGDEILMAAFASPKNRHGGLKSLIMSPHLSMDNLWVHASTLVDLDIRGYSVSGGYLQLILTSCPTLRSLLALTEEMQSSKRTPRRVGNFNDDPIISSRDLEYHDSWECLDLERLHLKFKNGSTSCSEDSSNRSGIPRSLFYQIQRLKRLRDLRLCLVPPTWEDSGYSKGSPYLHEWMSTVEMWGSINAGDAMKAFGDLEDLETLELWGLKSYVSLSLDAAKDRWPKMKRVFCS